MSDEMQTIGAEPHHDLVIALTALLRYPGTTPDKIMEVMHEFLTVCRSEGIDPLTVLEQIDS